MSRLGHVTLVVRDYDEAIAFYVGALGFHLVADDDLGGGKRWVLVSPAGADATALLLARAVGDAQRARVGDQTGGRVFLFLESDNFARDYERMTAAGVTFIEEPRTEAYGTVAVFEDLYGNRWDLIERQPRVARFTRRGSVDVSLRRSTVRSGHGRLSIDPCDAQASPVFQGSAHGWTGRS